MGRGGLEGETIAVLLPSRGCNNIHILARRSKLE